MSLVEAPSPGVRFYHPQQRGRVFCSVNRGYRLIEQFVRRTGSPGLPDHVQHVDPWLLPRRRAVLAFHDSDDLMVLGHRNESVRPLDDVKPVVTGSSLYLSIEHVVGQQPGVARYVTVEGPVVEMTTPVDPDERRALAHRYLGPELGDMYIESTPEDVAAAGSVMVRIEPRHWLSTDYGKQFG